MVKSYQMTDQELDLVASCLGKEPFQNVYQLLEKLTKQYHAQNKKPEPLPEVKLDAKVVKRRSRTI